MILQRIEAENKTNTEKKMDHQKHIESAKSDLLKINEQLEKSKDLQAKQDIRDKYFVIKSDT